MTRREFMGLGSAGVLSICGCRHPWCCGLSRIRLAMAGYTLNSFGADAALAFCRKHGFHHLCVKDFHLPFDSSARQIEEFRRKCEDHDVVPYGVGPILMDKKDEVRRYFDYASALGVDLIVGIPSVNPGPDWRTCRSDRGMCELCSGLADEYRVRYAIHNHGRNPETGNPKLYPAVPETFELIGDLSPRMGFCVDWAYTYADALDCAEIAFKYGNRIFDGHVRCLSDGKNGSSGVGPSRRVFDYDGIICALKKIGYDGCLGLELANAFPDNPQWIDESRAYFEDLLRDV